jgi:hypothetical protein
MAPGQLENLRSKVALTFTHFFSVWSIVIKEFSGLLVLKGEHKTLICEGECLPSKHKALSSIPSTIKEKKKKNK